MVVLKKTLKWQQQSKSYKNFVLIYLQFQQNKNKHTTLFFVGSIIDFPPHQCTLICWKIITQQLGD